ncbi:MAG: hypothetical protein LC134_05625 [Chitinophagales bacterium]|nr:hypothetical protein [Chitinophagales bacterium]
MRYYIQKHWTIFLLFGCILLFNPIKAQVNTVEFGKNRIQFKKFKWKFYQSKNFNTYMAQGGTELAKFVSEVAEEELPEIETFIEYSLRRRSDIIVYINFEEYKQSNLGLGIDWQQAGGLTKLVNNKIVVFFDGNHNHLKQQIRQGIAKVLTDNLLFGDDIGEFASNQALLDLPTWLTDGYIAYAAENWSTQKDDELKSEILSGQYKTFYHFAYKKPVLAGNALWNYIAEKYKKENVTYFLYLARMYKNLNTASQKICKKKFKDVLADFMQDKQDQYYEDIRKRKNAPKGKRTISEDVSKHDYYNFQINPNSKNNAYAMVQYKKGMYSVILNDNYYDVRTLLKKGVRVMHGDQSPNYPIISWDVKGTRLLVIYAENAKIKMFVWDYVAKYKRFKQEIEGVDQILDASFMLDANTVILSAVKNGHSDIFIYKIQENKLEQITDDIYDDLNPTYVTFPNRSGIIFSSNRPSADAPNSDTVIPSRNRFNVFLVDILNRSAIKQITQLSNLQYSDATYPMQYNVNHFTFIADETGIGNRYAGFFSTQREGLDSLFYIGDELLRNPTKNELDSTLAAWRKEKPDSVSYFQIYKDSTYTFPITNYQSSILETRIAGNNGLVSEVRREGDYKYLFKLQVDEKALYNRNVNPALTNYMRELRGIAKQQKGKPTKIKKETTTKNTTTTEKPVAASDTSKPKNKKVFRTEFDNEEETTDTTVTVVTQKEATEKESAPKKRLFNYKLKFGTDYVLGGITNNILINRYQIYGGGSGPIQLNNGNDINWSFRVGISDVMEDIKIVGGIRFGQSLTDKDAFISFQNFRRRLDWGVTYYRSVISNFFPAGGYNNRLNTNLYQVNVSYPFDETKSLKATVGYRSDRGIMKAEDHLSLPFNDTITKYALARIEYVYDNTINPAQNIWKGLRWKTYMDFNLPMVKGATKNFNFNFGFDARNYVEIYRNFIWATRVAGDFSWGDQKIIYYLGGVDGWIKPKFNNANTPAPDQTYAFQSLAVNMRGFNQNVANGNNAVVINSELRFPVFATLLNKPINNAFLRNFQLVQFVDLGTAWNGKFNGIERPYTIYPGSNPDDPVSIRIKAGGIGPFVGGYGFGARSTLLGYFLKADVAWEMNGLFKGKPIFYFALGLDF